MKERIYISGPITGTDDYLERFSEKEGELEKDLEQEESICDHCEYRVRGKDYCEGCGTYGNIQDMEQQLAAIRNGE